MALQEIKRKLSAAGLRSLVKTPGKHADGGGLFLLVGPDGSAAWRYKYRIAGREKQLSLGLLVQTSLAEARERHLEARKLVAQGLDPSAARQAARRAQEEANENTFAKVADRYISRWQVGKADNTKRNAAAEVKHLKKVFGKLPVTAITTRAVVQGIEALEAAHGAQEANRMLRLTRRILGFAKQVGLIEVNVAADMQGVVAAHKVKNHPAQIETEGFAKVVRAIDSYPEIVVRSAIQMLLLTVSRPGELVAMRWDELRDLEGPAPEWRHAMPKVDEERIVPLSRQAVEVLKVLHGVTGESEWVFTGKSRAGHLAALTPTRIFRDSLGLGGKQTPHSLRASFRTIGDEVLGIDIRFLELQLGHRILDVHGGAYNRARHLEGRRVALQRWADFIDDLRRGGTGSNVVPLRRPS